MKNSAEAETGNLTPLSSRPDVVRDDEQARHRDSVLQGEGQRRTQVGRLWTPPARRLATVTFTGESAYGGGGKRQTANLSNHGALRGDRPTSPPTTNSGHYSEQTNAFANRCQVLVTAYLGAHGHLRVRRRAFPTLSWKNAAYFVDVQFQPLTRIRSSSLARTRRSSPSPIR